MADWTQPEIVDRENGGAPDTSIVIDPLKYGLSYDVRVCIFDEATRVRSYFMLSDQKILRIPDGLQKTKLKFKLQVLRDRQWCDASPYTSILPLAFQASLPQAILRFPGDLSATLRHNVVLAPYRSLYKKNPPWGYFAAYENGTFIPEAHHVVMGKQGYAPAAEPKVRQSLAGTYIYGDSLGGAYGHIITEGISRLWYARQNPDIPIIWVRGRHLTTIHMQILEFLQIKNKHIFLSDNTRVEKCIFPLPALSIGDYILPGYFDFVGIEPSQDPIAGRKLFLSRSRLDAPSRIHTEAKELDELMQRFGFDLFYPEQHCLKEQLRFISSAEVVCGVEGSAFHSLVFYNSVPKTRFVALGRHRMGTGIYSQIKHGKGLNYLTLNVLRGLEGLKLNARSEVFLNIEELERILSLTRGFLDMANLPSQLICDDTPPPLRNYLDIVQRFPAKMNEPQSLITELITNLENMDRQEAREKLGSLFSFVS